MNSMYIFQLLIILMVYIINMGGKSFGDFTKHSEKCAVVLENFSAASARFMFCTIQNSRPVNVCCSCIEEYNEVLENHDKIIEVNKKSNASCDEHLINQDRLEVIESGFSYIKDLWSKGQCLNCFKNNTSLSNTTKEFIELYSETSSCLDSQYDPKNKTFNPDVCSLCSEQYYKMSGFYAKLKETSGNGNVCMDIVDTVNVTQRLWSNVLHCGETVLTIEIPLILLSSIFCLLPIIFYLSAWKFTKARTADVLNQNRVSQRFRDRWRSPTASLLST